MKMKKMVKKTSFKTIAEGVMTLAVGVRDGVQLLLQQGQVGENPHFHFRGHGFYPWSGTKILQAMQPGQKNPQKTASGDF